MVIKIGNKVKKKKHGWAERADKEKTKWLNKERIIEKEKKI